MTELFQYETCKDAVSNTAEYLLKQIHESQGQILLLLSGGSSLNAVREVFANLKPADLKRIHLGQIDGRFVGLEEEANNWRQITEALGGKLNQTASQLVMMNHGEDPDDIAITYEMELRALLETADIALGVYGVGEDGHIAGMLPTEEPQDFTHFLDGRVVVAYEAKDYYRITTTAALLGKLDDVVVFACGQQKVNAIEKINRELPAHKHPLQLLKDAKRATIFLGREQA